MSHLPTGTVTFLFTDIEGSTPLWEQMPDAMRPAVDVNLALLHQVVAEHAGVTFKVIGDAIQAAFPLAGQALAAALAAQTRLQSAPWPAQTGPLKVRMGLHTGPAELAHTTSGGTDYAISHTLNRVARIMSAGAGGQILISQETADLVERDLPPGVSLADLGERQMKGMARLEHIFMVCAPGLPQDFPPLASGISYPKNLPALMTSFIGRETEMQALQSLITSGSARLVTLTGPGGTGKTRLAQQVAFSLNRHFPDGIWLVELAPLADPALVPLTTAAVLGLHETAGKPIRQKLVEFLAKKQLLLILDNCEHVVEEAANLAGLLLQACPRLQILATSREILGTLGETPFRVPSLSLPAGHATTLTEISSCESIHLFIERAQTVLPGFKLTETNAPVVARICQRLDGIPLALELAAARVRLLSVEQIAARLDDSFRLLTGGSRTVLSRHQTLRALIDWSYNLLTPPERTLFMRLSVFAGGFTLEAVEMICSDPTPDLSTPAAAGRDLDADAILDLLSQLVDKSLVIPLDDADGTTARYRMLETIRQYARDKLHEAGLGLSVRDQHLAYYMLLAEEAEPYLRGGDQVAWLDRLDSELDNLRLALEWSLPRRVEAGLRLAGALLWFWHIRGHGSEGSEWLRQLLEAALNQSEATVAPNQALIRARALISAGFLTQFHTRDEQSQPLLAEAIQILQGLGPLGRGWLGVAQLFLSKQVRDPDQRLQMLERALPLLREMDNPLYLAEYTMELGGLLVVQNKPDLATRVYRESMAYREKGQDIDGLGTAAMALGDGALFAGDYAGCQQFYEQSLAAYQTVKNKTMESLLLMRLGNLDLLTGDFSQAAERFSAGIAITQQTGDRQGMINSLYNLGRLDLNIGEFLRAGKRFAEIQRIGLEVGSKEAVLDGLLFQAVATAQLGDSDKVLAFIHQALEIWRGFNHAAYNIYFLAGHLELLALLLADHRPDLSMLLFSAVDHAVRLQYQSNTAVEVGLFKTARAKAAAALTPEQLTALQQTASSQTLLAVLEQAFAQLLPQ